MDIENVVCPYNGVLLGYTRNGILIHATTRGNLESVPVNERNQTQRPHTVWFHLCEMSRIGKPTETESGYMVAWDWAKTGRGRDGLVGMGVSFRGDENVLELNTGKRLHCECTKCHQSVHFKFYILKWLIYVI